MEFFVGLTSSIDFAVRFFDRLAQRVGDWQIFVLAVEVGNVVDRKLASKLTSSMGTHAISHDEEVAAFLLLFKIAGRRKAQIVLIGRPPHADIANRSDLQIRIPIDETFAHFIHSYCMCHYRNCTL